MRFLFAFLVSIFAFTACKDRVICPAFQSTYILDDSVRMTYYSYLWKLDESERTRYLSEKASSTSNEPIDTSATAAILAATSPQPKKTDYFAYAGQYKVEEREVKKTKYGMIKYEPYWLKNYHMRTAPMENVLSPKDEIIPVLQEDTAAVDVGEFYAADFEDSLGMDSTQVAMNTLDSAEDVFVLPTLARAPPPEKEPEPEYLYRYDPADRMLNVEQDYYNKHFGKYLVRQPKPKPKPAPKAASEDTTGISSGGAGNMMPADDGADSFVEPEPTEEQTNEPIEEPEPVSTEPELTPEPQEESENQDKEQQGGDLGF